MTEAGLSWSPEPARANKCRNKTRYTEGDHDIFVGEVLHCEQHAGLAPLLYHAGQFYTETPL